jgi:hypothetical protein
MQNQTIRDARDQALATLDARIWSAGETPARACFTLARAVTVSTFTALDDYVRDADEIATGESLAVFVEVILPRALSAAAMAIVGATTPEDYVAIPAAILNLEFAATIADATRQMSGADATAIDEASEGKGDAYRQN